MKGSAIGILLAVAILACGGGPQTDTRHEAHMSLEPPQQFVFEARRSTVPEAKKVCPDAHPVPAKCNDVCDLAVAICDNAETICNIAAELGKQDDYAQSKCESATASCREAKQRCCNCSGDGP